MIRRRAAHLVLARATGGWHGHLAGGAPDIINRPRGSGIPRLVVVSAFVTLGGGSAGGNVGRVVRFASGRDAHQAPDSGLLNVSGDSPRRAPRRGRRDPDHQGSGENLEPEWRGEAQ